MILIIYMCFMLGFNLYIINYRLIVFLKFYVLKIISFFWKFKVYIYINVYKILIDKNKGEYFLFNYLFIKFNGVMCIIC